MPLWSRLARRPKPRKCAAQWFFSSFRESEGGAKILTITPSQTTIAFSVMKAPRIGVFNFNSWLSGGSRRTIDIDSWPIWTTATCRQGQGLVTALQWRWDHESFKKDDGYLCTYTYDSLKTCLFIKMCKRALFTQNGNRMRRIHRERAANWRPGDGQNLTKTQINIAT